MQVGVEAGKQAFEVAKAVNELYVDQDEDDEELTTGMSDQEREEQGHKQRSEVVQSILRANHLAQGSRLHISESLDQSDRSFARTMGDQ